MTTKEGLQGLLERVEKEHGPDRSLDGAIYIEFTIPKERIGRVDQSDGVVGWHPNDAPYVSAVDVPKYTASIDAALALAERVSPGWIEVNGPRKYLNIPTPVPNHWRAEVSGWTGWGHTAPLAILSALLRALIAQKETE